MEHLLAYYEQDGHADGEGAELLRRLYVVEQAISRSSIPAAMRNRLRVSGRDPQAFEVQTSVGIWSRYLPSESLAFNRVRSQRFGSGFARRPSEGGALDADMARMRCDAPGASDFCDVRNRTMADERIGYVEGENALAFANMGRLNALHAVVATRVFVHPLHLARTDVVGLFTVANEWFEAARLAHPTEARFPTLTWDLLRNGGASQAHPHVQPHLARSRYPGRWEAYRRAACDYASHHRGGSLFADVARTHARLGLVVRRTRRVVAFVALTSVAAGPMIELFADGTPPTAAASSASVGPAAAAAAGGSAAALAREIGEVTHDLILAAQQALGWDGLSMSCAFPPTAEAGGAAAAGLPRICRLVPRGTYSGAVSDVSANELFETPSVAVDLFEAARKMRHQMRAAAQGHPEGGADMGRSA